MCSYGAACLQDAVGDRVTAVYSDGSAVCISLPFTPAHPLPACAHEALSQALDPPVWHSLLCRSLTVPGLSSCSL
jgi:hypothetical protein